MKTKVYLFAAFLFIISSCAIEQTLPGDPIYVDSIAITNKINDISIGKQHQFTAAYYPLDAEGFDVFTWQSSDNTIATIDQNGLLNAVDEGKVTITLTAEVAVKKGTTVLTDEVAVTVLPVAIEGVQLNRNYLEILNHSTFTLTASLVPSNAKPKEIEWSSSDVSVATVVDGVVIARSAGMAIITARAKGTDIQDYCTVVVNPIVVKSMQFETKDVQLEIGFSVATVLIFDPDSTENKNVTYSSSNAAIASVSSYGVITG